MAVQRLNVPRPPARLAALHPRPDLIGRISEGTARIMGTARFLAAQSVFLLVWLVINLPGSPLRFDLSGYPLLTLVLSLQAAYAAPLILLAQNRQDDRDRVTTAQDRSDNERLVATVEYLTRELAALHASTARTATRAYLDDALERQLAAIATVVDAARHSSAREHESAVTVRP